MSNIYIQEPPTSGKVVLKTSFGDIEIELWSREAPKACRNFVQLCLEGYYDGVLFHRIVKGFIAQGGDPTGTGSGGESVYGYPFKDEIHSRLRFNRRGLVAMANAGKDDNGSQFFFTLGSTPELQSKHTIFGKVAGDTIFNLTKLNETLVDKEDKPVYDQKILKTIILNNPFSDIVPRIEKKVDKIEKSSKKKESVGVKNFKLLSFGEEAEEDEDELNDAVKEFSGKPKSTHDILKDPQLSSAPAVIDNVLKDDMQLPISDQTSKISVDDVRSKLSSQSKKKNVSKPADPLNIEDSDEEYELGQDIKKEKKRKLEEIRKEIKDIKTHLSKKKNNKVKDQVIDDKPIEAQMPVNPLKQEYLDNFKFYSSKKSESPYKGLSREEFSLNLLQQFKNKLNSAKQSTLEKKSEELVEDEDSWKSCSFQCKKEDAVLAKDANKKDDDWFEIYDPRSTLNKRKRELTRIESKTNLKSDNDKKG
ncbi:Cyclophilin-like domain,Cyclophilin-type peptidyl-prolyl cis-trans isomerase domain,Cyclophilin- [Cinara cedri]|uniref:Spliceosome-associated protein CWC27 homolog n=1 Tax=Cinara cedri TaxID=506608 RepID=A0A5E4MAM7_9HEMI|nr:Cyclophilin-like domain,Cyclophilin-type peptidyl-prolyl cis-trans isomerase domain,Cyclophilin- [Cinara cedri]